MDKEDIVAIAKRELAEERYREAVDEIKEKLRKHKPWWHRIFPYHITITRRPKDV